MSERIVDLTDVASVAWEQAPIELKLFGLPVREEIVRCRDCKHYRTLNDFGLCHPLGIVLADMGNGFCAWAVRKHDE